MIRILVVDDETEILSVLDAFLTKKGYSVRTVDNGKEAVDILSRDTGFDIAVLDQRMPGIGGSQVAQRLKMLKIDIPVIILTGSIGDNALREGFDAILTKPIDLGDLDRKIRELTGG